MGVRETMADESVLPQEVLDIHLNEHSNGGTKSWDHVYLSIYQSVTHRL